MDNPTRWNITNSAQNIVSALVDPSKQFDSVFRREWSNTFAGLSARPVSNKDPTTRKSEADLKTKLDTYVSNLQKRKHIKTFELQNASKSQQINQQSDQHERLNVPEIFFHEEFDLSDLETFNKVISSVTASNNDGALAKLNYPSNNEDDPNCYDSYTNRRLREQKEGQAKLLTKSQLRDLQQYFTDYLDMIEEKLANQISSRSGDFFQVMSSVDCVMDELSLAIKSVTSLRKKCYKLNEALISPNMKIINLNRTRDNAQIVLDKMNEIAYLYKVHPKLLGADFSNLSELVESVSNGFSDISEKNSLTLSSLLQIQAEKFVNKFHEERKRRLENILDLEQWKTIDDVPVDFQRLITQLVDDGLSISETLPVNHTKRYSSSASSSADRSKADQALPLNTTTSLVKGVAHHSRASSDATGLISIDANLKNEKESIDSMSSSRIHKVSTMPTSVAQIIKRTTLETSDASIPNSNGKVGYVIAAGSTYVIVNSVVNLIRTLMDYCKCAHDIRSLSADLLERLFKILQLYNSKTYHLVYSAGAVQVAGLKNITTRSLVVSQRSLKLIILLIPAIYKHFSELLPDSNRLRHFDEIVSSYEDHAAKIPERVNSIVNDVINMQLMEWEAKPPVPSIQFSAIAQHFMRLHDNIEDALPAQELRCLFLRIGETFKDVLIKHLRRLSISNDAGPQQWLVTQELTYYRISLNKLNAFKGWELNFDDLWSRLDSSKDT